MTKWWQNCHVFQIWKWTAKLLSDQLPRASQNHKTGHSKPAWACWSCFSLSQRGRETLRRRIRPVCFLTSHTTRLLFGPFEPCENIRAIGFSCNLAVPSPYLHRIGSASPEKFTSMFTMARGMLKQLIMLLKTVAMYIFALAGCALAKAVVALRCRGISRNVGRPS